MAIMNFQSLPIICFLLVVGWMVDMIEAQTTSPVPSPAPTYSPTVKPSSKAPSIKPLGIPTLGPTPGPSNTIPPSSIDPTTREQWLYDQLTNFNSWLSPTFIAIKYGKMDQNAFTFYRGAAHLMYKDITTGTLPIPTLWSSTPNISSWCMGDGHIENVGYFNNGLTQAVTGSPSNNGLNGLVVFDVNDFDESWISPFYFDLLRGVSGLYLDIDVINNYVKCSGCNAGQFWTNQIQARNLAMQYITAYFDAMSSVNGNDNEVNSYMVSNLPPGTVAPKMVYNISRIEFTGLTYVSYTALTTNYIESSTAWGTNTQTGKSTTVTNGQRVFLYSDTVTMVTPSDKDKIDASWPMYVASLNQTFVAQKLRQNANYFSIKGYANKLLSGIGSTGTRRIWVLIEGASSGVYDDVMLIMKEAIIPSMLLMGSLGGHNNASLALYMKRYTLSNGAPNYGMHSAEGSRVMTAYLEPFTGYTVFNDGFGLGGSFCVRRATPVAKSKSAGNGDFTSLTDFTSYALFHARALAFSHARSDNDIPGGMVNYSVEAGIMNAVNNRWGGLSSVISQMLTLGENYYYQVRSDYALYMKLRAGTLLKDGSTASLTSTPTVVSTAAPSPAGTSIAPSPYPSPPPTYRPSASPTLLPTPPPTNEPSFAPSLLPTFRPSPLPTTEQPTTIPSPSPSIAPSAIPTTIAPSALPTTFKPSVSPSIVPSALPTTLSPSVSPSFTPSFFPSTNPSFTPSFSPSFTPSSSPSTSPTKIPTIAPSTPTSAPTYRPTPLPGAPTWEPTLAPTYEPSFWPTFSPTAVPTFLPSPLPSFDPTTLPSFFPTQEPSFRPSYIPSLSPTSSPTMEPTTAVPTNTRAPTISSAPTFTSSPTTANPSFLPTEAPSMEVTSLPTIAPVVEAAPTARPTMTSFPTPNPSTLPTVQAGAPTNAPTVAVVAFVKAKQVFSGLTPEVAQSPAFKSSVQTSVAFALNVDPTVVTINSVTLATIRRALLAVGDATVSYTVKVVNTDPAAVATTLQSPSAVAAVTVAMAVDGYAVTTQPPTTVVVQASPAPAVAPSSSNKMDSNTLIGIIVGSCVGGICLLACAGFVINSTNKKRKQASAVAMARQSMLNNHHSGGTGTGKGGTGTGPEESFPVSMNPVFMSGTEPKKESLAPQIQNKVPWKDDPHFEESEIRQSEMALPSGKMSRDHSVSGGKMIRAHSVSGHQSRSGSTFFSAPRMGSLSVPSPPEPPEDHVSTKGPRSTKVPLSSKAHPSTEAHHDTRDSMPPAPVLETIELEQTTGSGKKLSTGSVKSAWDLNAKL